MPDPLFSHGDQVSPRGEDRAHFVGTVVGYARSHKGELYTIRLPGSLRTYLVRAGDLVAAQDGKGKKSG